MDATLDLRTEIREFLRSRRARIAPEKAGLPAYGGNRRVKGLRREEVALLAGVSVEYYVRIERGSLAGASRACSTRWPRRCSSTKPSATTCSISHANPGRPAVDASASLP